MHLLGDLVKLSLGHVEPMIDYISVFPNQVSLEPWGSLQPGQGFLEDSSSKRCHFYSRDDKPTSADSKILGGVVNTCQPGNIALGKN